ncbi:MAG: PrgI family protein [Patescibacteria group bacterium]
MQFQVPQFIDIEDKVIGPMTIKQFLYLLTSGVTIFIIYKILNIVATIILAIPIAGIGIALAFVRVSNQPFVNFIKNFMGFIKKPDFYVWKKPIGKNNLPEQTEERVEIIKKMPAKTKLNQETKDNLQDMSWKVEIEK